jgi:hypothetical protein
MNAPGHAPSTPSPSEPSPSGPFAKQAANFSLYALVVSILLGAVTQSSVQGNRLAMGILGLVSASLIVAGFVLGIAAFVSAARHGIPGVRARAIVGTCICGLLTVIVAMSIPIAIRAAQQAKERQMQMDQKPR